MSGERMDIAAFAEALSRELFGLELGRDISTRHLARRLAEIVQFRSAWTFQKWLSGDVQWGHDADLVWAALFSALGEERLLEEIIVKSRDDQTGSKQISDEEMIRVRRVAQMLRRGRYVGPVKSRFINEDDARYLSSGVMPARGYLPLCASSGPPYVSRDDLEQLHLFVIESASGESVAFSYMDPVGPGLPGRSLEVHGVVQDFHELPTHPPQHVRERFPLLSGAWRAAKMGSRAFEDRMGLKLVGVEPVLTEGRGDAQEAVMLHLQLSDYFKGRVTNHILDNMIPGRTPLPLNRDGNWSITYRDEWCGSMAYFGDSLANLMQVNGFVITTGDPGPPRVHLGVRGAGVATNPRLVGSIAFTPSISGAAAQGRYHQRSEIDVDVVTGEIRYDPQVTMLREGSEEVWGRGTSGEGRPFPDSWLPVVRFLGLSRVFTSYDPFLFGHIDLKASEAEFKAFLSSTTDKFDVENLHTMSLDVDSVIEFAEATSPIVHTNAGPTVSVVLFMLYHEICYRYPDSVPDFKGRYVSALNGTALSNDAGDRLRSATRA